MVTIDLFEKAISEKMDINDFISTKHLVSKLKEMQHIMTQYLIEVVRLHQTKVQESQVGVQNWVSQLLT